MNKQYHLHLLSGKIDETIFLPGDVNRCKIIADHFDERNTSPAVDNTTHLPVTKASRSAPPLPAAAARFGSRSRGLQTNHLKCN